MLDDMTEEQYKEAVEEEHRYRDSVDLSLATAHQKIEILTLQMMIFEATMTEDGIHPVTGMSVEELDLAMEVETAEYDALQDQLEAVLIKAEQKAMAKSNVGRA